ncbi:Phosphate-selective porin O and P [Thalassolituus maritimus]|uniref:Phosphate-selective porin O and P n=1 Tax=Thalassolituus maritimus TaxID=484498 RepID=A0A1N7MBI4_9GAMM|nr:porin [Thalassolituus maritimus]SIS83339.1 Phosphate-selective porin O and P [Thalassolituus maritimus]
MKKLAVLGTAIALSNMTFAADAATQAQIDELKAQIAALADTVDAQAEGPANPVYIGGYGEMHLNLNQGKDNEIDYHRFVLFFGKEFTDKVRFFSELELEHSLAGEGKPGEVELEQAYVEVDVTENTQVKTGLFLLPVGILNETHEPETFYGVERNNVEKRIIPTTWWEGGVMVSGQIADGLSYDVAMHSGLNAAESDANGLLTGVESVRSSRQKVAEATANKAAYTARLKYTAVPGLELAVSGQYQDDILQGAGDDEIGAALLEAHAVYQTGDFGIRALYAQWNIDSDVEDAVAGASKQNGYYIEPSYRINEQVGVFYRNSMWDTAAGDSDDSEKTQNDIGVNYWLADTAVLKADYFRQETAGELSATGYNLGVGFSF